MLLENNGLITGNYLTSKVPGSLKTSNQLNIQKKKKLIK